MKSPKSYLEAFGLEQKDERTDRVAKALVEEAAAERREKNRILRRARLERDSTDGDVARPGQVSSDETA